MRTIPRRFAPGIVPDSQRLLDNSTYKLQFATLLKFESHYDLRFERSFLSLSTSVTSIPQHAEDSPINETKATISYSGNHPLL